MTVRLEPLQRSCFQIIQIVQAPIFNRQPFNRCISSYMHGRVCEHSLPSPKPSLYRRPATWTQASPLLADSRFSCKPRQCRKLCTASTADIAAAAAAHSPEASSAEVPGDRSLGASLPGGRTAIKLIKVSSLTIAHERAVDQSRTSGS